MNSLESRIENFIKTSQGDFNRLACELFQFQYSSNPAYHNYASSVCKHCQHITHWKHIPTLPIVAFKEAAIATFPFDEANVVFHSSGTTSAHRSSHYLKNADPYDLSIIKGWPAPPEQPVRIYALSPPPDVIPDSSLVHMFQTLIHHYGDPESTFVPYCSQFSDFLHQTQKEGLRLWLLGTAIGWNDFLNYCDSKKCSYVFKDKLLLMETGGFKGRSESVLPSQLYTRLCDILGIPFSSILSEYSMAELSSQFYTHQNSQVRSFHSPNWVRWQIVHPLSGEPVPSGQKGVLEIFDLANIHSAFAIRTEDLAHAHADGFILDGRVLSAPAKGCSLTL